MEKKLTRVAATQLGLIHRRQIADLGLTRNQLRRRVERGDLERRAPRVYSVPGAPRSREQQRLLALLDAGADSALSHRTAASVWGLDTRSGGLHAVVPRRGAIRANHVARLHQVRDLEPGHTVFVGPLRVTTPARTIMDLAAVEPLGQVARALDRAWGRRLLNIGALASVLRQVRIQGRRGVRFIELLVEERLHHRPAESGLELRFEDVLRRRGMVVPARQVDVSDHDGWFARVDYLDERDGRAVFIDGATWHLALTDKRNDDETDRRLRAMGLEVLRFSDAQVFYDQDHIVRTMRRATSAA